MLADRFEREIASNFERQADELRAKREREGRLSDEERAKLEATERVLAMLGAVKSKAPDRVN